MQNDLDPITMLGFGARHKVFNKVKTAIKDSMIFHFEKRQICNYYAFNKGNELHVYPWGIRFVQSFNLLIIIVVDILHIVCAFHYFHFKNNTMYAYFVCYLIKYCKIKSLLFLSSLL